MAWKCAHCGIESDEPLYIFDDSTGYTDQQCPHCLSCDIEEIDECAVCGAEKCVDSLIKGVCENCIKTAAENFNDVYAFAQENSVSRNINGLFAWILTDGEIDAILTNWLITNDDLNKYTKKYCEDKKIEFADWIKKRRKK